MQDGNHAQDIRAGPVAHLYGRGTRCFRWYDGRPVAVRDWAPVLRTV
ncbi:hypothetical protein GCM10028793_26310 [Nocardiopsis oceani]